jgi:hypothetical protein
MNKFIKRFFLSVMMAAAGLFSAQAQTPAGFNYQGVARDNQGFNLALQPLTLRFTIHQETATGTALFSEVRKTVTDSFGVFTVTIGGAGAVSQSQSLKTVQWGSGSKFLQVELDTNRLMPGIYTNMGAFQLLSVPFAYYADVADSSKLANTANGSGRYFFSATLQPDVFQTIPNGFGTFSTVKFPQVRSNEGNVYNAASSEFTAPDSGLYQFNIDVSRYVLDFENSDGAYGLEANLWLFKNDKVVKIISNPIIRRRTLAIMGTSGTYQEELDNNNLHANTLRLKLLEGDKISLRIMAEYFGLLSPLRLGISAATLTPAGNGLDVAIDELTLMEFSGYKIK